MASIDPTKVRADGRPARDTRWRARYRDPQGRSRSKTFDRKADAERFLQQVGSEIQHGGFVDPLGGRLTLAEWVEQYLATVVDLRPSTVATYNRDLTRYVLPQFGGVRLANLTGLHIQRWLAEELATGLAPSSVHRHYRTLRRVLQVAVEFDVLGRNPCDAVKPPALPKDEMRFLSPEEVEDLAAAMTARWRPMLYTLAYVGLRWSEVVGLRRRNVDLLRRAIRVTEQLIRLPDTGTWVWSAPKTKAGIRTVSVPPFLVELLEQQLGEWAVPGEAGLVFPNSTGGPIIASSWQHNVWVRAKRRAGIEERCRVHDLRHTAVAFAIANGAHPKAIQQRMGHSSVQVTLDRYGHLFPEIDEAIAEGLEQTYRSARRLAEGPPSVTPTELRPDVSDGPA